MSLRRSLIAALALGLLAPAAASADRLTVRGTQVFTSVARDLPTQFGGEFASFNGYLYFVANDDVHGNELWRTNGTNEGTALVADVYPGLPNTHSNPHRLTVVGDRLFFNATPATDQSSESLFYIDAAQPTTVKRPSARKVTDNSLTPAVGPIFGAPNGRVVISRLLGEQGNCCYSVYALPPGGTVLQTIAVGAEDANTNNSFSPSATAGGWTYYSRSNTNISPGEGAELWRTNGVVTESVANIYPDSGTSKPGSAPSAFVATSDRVYFTADDGVHGRELWVTNPADKADTHMVHEHAPGTAGTSINDPGQAANGNILYYVPANDPVTGAEVWRTDGTEAGTRVVKDITPGPGGFSQPGLFPLRGGVGILRGDVFASSDGTDAGTALIGSPDGDGYGANTPVPFGDRAYFVGGFTPFGQALWRTDGTAAGTGALSAAGYDGTAATSGNPAAQTLAVLGTKLIFFGRDRRSDTTGGVKMFVIDTTQPDEIRQATAAPSISGSPTVGTVLTADKGAWTLENRFTYQWLRNGVPAPNAEGAGYYVGPADVGVQITVRVTATGVGLPNRVSAESAPVTGAAAVTAPVTVGGGTPPRSGGTTAPPKAPALVVKKKGKLTGAARVGKTLTIGRPTFDRTGVKLTYVWMAGGKPIKGQTKPTLKITKALKGKKISVAITATKAGYSSTTIKLGPSAKVKAASR